MGLANGMVVSVAAGVFAWRDLRTLYRWAVWRRAPATMLPAPGGWRFDFVLPGGRPVSVVTDDINSRGWRHGPTTVTVLYNPRRPARGLELFTLPGLAARLAFTALAASAGVWLLLT